MATDPGPYFSDNGGQRFIYYYGFFSESTFEMIEDSPLDANGAPKDFSVYYNQPGFTQKWGAAGYFIRPEYLDPLSMYRPQVLYGGNIPAAQHIGGP